MNDSLPLPMDVKLMNVTASVLFTGVIFVALVAVLWWAVRHPLFAIGGITVQGDLAHNNAVTLRANVAPKLDGNFFTVDLAKTRGAFEAVPWVRRALVRREFPNRLKVVLQEHQVAAYWGSEGDSRLLSALGEVFEANVGEVEQEDLPRLAGPEGQAPQVLAMYRALAPLFTPLDTTLEQLELTSRGGWRARTDAGAVIELGSGTIQEVSARTERFVHTLTQVAARHGRSADAVETADLRYGEGYALRLRGVTTLTAQPKK
jgi:cell division protein FtsQ